MWDVLAVVRFCRSCLPKPCTIIAPHSYFRGTHDLRDPSFGRHYAAIDVHGRRMTVRGVKESEFVDPPVIVVSFLDTTVDLLA